MTSEHLILLSGAVLALLGCVLFAVVVIAHKYIDAIEACLPSCSYVGDNKRVWSSAGLLGEVMRGGVLAMVLLMPKMHAKRGLVDVQEIKNLPKLYKYLLTVPLITCGVLLMVLLALNVAEKYLG
ncbi:hypothetical protein [Pseudomonas viridiflava]|uniref:Uncharacterized protein n=1 Tax=Pseudomonas viridiflava TaxID=33069 RepID=A0ABU7N4Q0_PSEVI|nr:hypothetical protein [Pseudomonas viridiflava]KIQ37063.1 hypothetical protein RT94_03450 [Pseudomonas viridiflava]MBI6574231.1 hypothetical protein [Pseudomonas viridiflava]MBI6605937.1 hypothetical protein [Pseudomonas viridiflava]MBI6638098.1 hypothetical protein [Pseudomonas viridiflava]MBI6867805.1 hypothetical protein [Pseudomonas viridiflava]